MHLGERMTDNINPDFQAIRPSTHRICCKLVDNHEGHDADLDIRVRGAGKDGIGCSNVAGRWDLQVYLGIFRLEKV